MRRFDLLVVGTGSGNTIVDEQFADRSVAMLDDGARFGGTCLNYGCIPTKMFVVPADLARAPGAAKRLGVKLGRPTVDWPAIRSRWQAWLAPANFDAEGRQRRHLSDIAAG